MENKQRLISATRLVVVLAKKFRDRMIHYDDLMATLADIPTVDAVEVAHGEWIKCDSVDCVEFDLLRCSVCGKVIMCAKQAPGYCCGCGAKMDGGGKS